MLLSWFDAKQAKEFGASLARFHIEKIPLEDSRNKNKALKKRSDALDKLFHKMAQFHIEHKLNFYTRAKLGNTFRWALRDAGYDPVYVDEITKQLMLIR